MFLNFPQVTLVSASVLALTLLGGCSNLKETSSQLYNPEKAPTTNYDRQYDAYYGSPSTNRQGQNYHPKIKRTVTKAKVTFKANAPQRYVVKKGDTLWGISNRFLNNPSYWPEIWDKNQKVKNPHLIYPGDVLYIYQGNKRTVHRTNGSVSEKMIPQMRIERGGHSGEPISTLGAFLAWPHVLEKHVVDNAPYVVGSNEAYLLFEKGQKVYAKNLSDKSSGGRYAIYHVGKMLKDPETKLDLGYEVIYTGFLEVEKPAFNADVSTAIVSESIREIRPGDKILPEKDEKNNLKAPIQRPKIKVRGTIISLFKANIISGESMIVTINKGARHGFKPGFTLGIYTPPRLIDDPLEFKKKKYKFEPNEHAKLGLPPERVGTAIVFKTLNNISYALITGSLNTIKKGYKIGNP